MIRGSDLGKNTFEMKIWFDIGEKQGASVSARKRNNNSEKNYVKDGIKYVEHYSAN